MSYYYNRTMSKKNIAKTIIVPVIENLKVNTYPTLIDGDIQVKISFNIRNTVQDKEYNFNPDSEESGIFLNTCDKWLDAVSIKHSKGHN